MYNFEFVKPASVADAVAALKDEDASALSGGQTLIPTLKQRLAQPSKLVSLSGMAELVGVDVGASAIAVKGATTHGAVAAATASAFPALADMASHIGDPAVRARGTVGGSLANNDPSACYPSAVLATGATVTTNARDIAADDYFQGMFTTALEEGEIITAVSFPIPEKAAYVKFVQPASRFALVGVFVAKYSDGVRVAITGASESGVFRWEKAEAALSANFAPEALEGLTLPGDDMISDLHGSGEYRAHLCGVITKRAVVKAG